MKPTVAQPLTVTAWSAVSAAVAALALAACSPNEGSDTAPLAGGGPAVNSAQVAAEPARQGTPVPPSAVAPAPAYAPMPPTQVAAAAPAPQPVPPMPAQSTTPAGYAPAPVDALPPASPPPRSVDRSRVGAITGIEPIRERPEGSGAGAVVGGLLGAVVGNQFGHGTGKAVMTGAGAVGGAIAGNNVERNHNTHVVGYHVSVRLDNGSVRTFQRTQVGNLQVGDRVQLDANSFHRV